MINQYECSSDYWDMIAVKEYIGIAGISEKYTQAQCLTAFKLGLGQLPWYKTAITMLKTDLWTEGIVRSREVLNHAVELAEQERFFVDSYGIDISKEICNRAVKHGTRAKIRQGDIRCLPYLNEYFDLILDVSTIDHIPFSEAKVALSEYYRCLRTNGVLVIMFAHDRCAIDTSKDCDKMKDCFPFSVNEVRSELSGFNIKGEYAIHFLNLPPAGRILQLGEMLHVPFLVTKLFKAFEFTPLSKFISGIAPLYVIIGVKK